jgi:hypothetical protein
MDCTKQEFRDAVLFIAGFIGPNKKRVYEHILYSVEVPELTKHIIYDMYVHKVKEENIKEFRMLRQYVEELNQKGFVTFK